MKFVREEFRKRLETKGRRKVGNRCMCPLAFYVKETQGEDVTSFDVAEAAHGWSEEFVDAVDSYVRHHQLSILDWPRITGSRALKILDAIPGARK